MAKKYDVNIALHTDHCPKDKLDGFVRPLLAASATAPVTMSFTLVPEANSAPPVENWMMPSLPASAKPLIAALTVSEEVQLMAGNAYEFSLARPNISA